MQLLITFVDSNEKEPFFKEYLMMREIKLKIRNSNKKSSKNFMKNF
jgi:hypothetical protein